MKRPTLLSALLVVVTLSLSTYSFAGGGHAISDIAGILMHLNHHPSSSEKDTLRHIANDSSQSDAVHAISMALVNLNHKATAQDKTKLQAIVDDSASSQHEKELANIIIHLNHKPSSRDKETLRAMSSH